MGGKLFSVYLSPKLLKPVYASLRSLGHFCMGHIDDSFLMGYNYASCKKNIVQTANMFLKLGFVIYPAKSILIPTQELEFLVFFAKQHFDEYTPPTQEGYLCQTGMRGPIIT